MSGRAVMIAALASCASPAGPHFDREAITTATVGGQTVVTSHVLPYELAFAAADVGIGMPASLQFDGDELIAGHAAACPTESGVGVDLYPAVCVAAPIHDGAVRNGATSNLVTSTLVFDLTGPAVARATVTWDIDYTCSKAHRTSGQSTFTLFPDGRIVRHDTQVRAVQVGDSVGATTGASCGATSAVADPADLLFLTAFWSFTAVSGDNRFADDTPAHDDPDATAACARWPGKHQVGVSWKTKGTSLRFAPNDTNAFVYDWFSAQTTLPDTPVEMVQVLDLAIGDQCSTLIAERTQPQTVRIDGTALTSLDGIWSDTTVHDRAFSVSTDHTLGSGFALAVDIGQKDHVEVTGSRPELASYALQRAGTTVILWFDGPFDPTDTLTIDPS